MPFLLDDIAPGAAAAYSLRQLAFTAASAIDLRRSSDNATQTIGFFKGNFDVAAATTFLAGSNGFVAKWYDQTTNGNHAVQATAAQQPQLILNVAALQGRPGILFVDVGAMGIAAPSATSIDDMFAAGGFNSNIVNYSGGATQKDRIWDKTGITLNFNTAGQSDVSLNQLAGGGNGVWFAPNLTTGAHIIDVSYSSASLANIPTLAYDGTAKTTTNTQPIGTVTSDAGSNLIIGGNLSNRGWAGHIAEVLFYKTTVPTATQTTTLRANQRAYFIDPQPPTPPSGGAKGRTQRIWRLILADGRIATFDNATAYYNMLMEQAEASESKGRKRGESDTAALKN